MTDEELLARILIAMGLTSYDEISEATLTVLLNEWQEVYPDSDCLVMHNTIISTYGYLIRNAAIDASGGGSTYEKEGNVTYEYDDYDKSEDWQSALDSYLKAPWEALPSCRSDLSSNVTARVKVGGVSEDTISEINNDSDIRTGGADEIKGVKRGSSIWYRSRNFYN